MAELAQSLISFVFGSIAFLKQCLDHCVAAIFCAQFIFGFIARVFFDEMIPDIYKTFDCLGLSGSKLLAHNMDLEQYFMFRL